MKSKLENNISFETQMLDRQILDEDVRDVDQF